jgi:hypothetical protein
VATPHRIDTHSHIVPPDYAAWLKRRSADAAEKLLPRFVCDRGGSLDLLAVFWRTGLLDDLRSNLVRIHNRVLVGERNWLRQQARRYPRDTMDSAHSARSNDEHES